MTAAPKKERKPPERVSATDWAKALGERHLQHFESDFTKGEKVDVEHGLRARRDAKEISDRIARIEGELARARSERIDGDFAMGRLKDLEEKLQRIVAATEEGG